MLPSRDAVLEVPADHSFASSNMSAKTELALLGKIAKVGIGFTLPPIIITVFSLYTYFQIENKILLLCPLISVISLTATLILIHYARDAKNLNLRADNRMFLALYVLHLCAASYFFIGFLLVFLFRGDAEILSKVNFALLGIEGGGVKYIIGYALLFILVRRLTIEYQSISNYIQVMQITLTICGIGILLTCESYKLRWDNLDISYHVPPVILDLGTVAGLCTVLLSLLTFYGSYTEKFSVLLLTQILNVLLMIFLLMLTAVLHKSNEVYIGVIEENCDYLLKILDYRMLQCEKYVDGPCEEQFLSTKWESGLENGEQCVNKHCCWEITEEVVLNLQIYMAWTLLTVVLLVFSWFGGQGLVKKIEKFGKSSEKKFEYRVALCLFFVYLVGAWCWFHVDHSAKLQKNAATVRVLGAEILPSQFITKDLCRDLEMAAEVPENTDKVVMKSTNGRVFPGELVGKTKKIASAMRNLKYCPDFASENYAIELSFQENSQHSTVFIIQESVTGYLEIRGTADGVKTLVPGSAVNPLTSTHLNNSEYSFTVPKLKHAYKISMIFNEQTVFFTVGGLYPTVPNIFITDSANYTLTLESFTPSTVELYSGLNSVSPLQFQTQISSGTHSLELPSGFYTLLSKSKGQITFKSNIDLYKPTSTEILSFSTLINEAFSIQFLKKSSKLFSYFEVGPETECHVSLKLPRCGGSRMLKFKNSEIFKVSEISASHYLVYAIGESFEGESVKFYSKGFLKEQFEVYGKEKGRVWMILCVDGRKGIGSLKVLDYYRQEVDFEACDRRFGNVTWSEKEIKKGVIKVE